MKRCFKGVCTADAVMTASYTDVRCPSCRHKLMEITADTAAPPEVSVMDMHGSSRYSVTTRCPRCKTYVGVVIRKMAI